MKKAIYILSTFMIISSCGRVLSGESQAEIPSLPVLEVKKTTAYTTVEYPAAIEGFIDLEIRPQIHGNIDKIFIDEGAYVSKGQDIFQIDDRPYRESLNQALANLKRAEAELIQSELEVKKFKPLAENKVVSEIQLESAIAASGVAAANLEQAKSNVESARINLGFTKVKAPVSGYIGRLLKKPGTLVSPMDVHPLTTLSDVHEVHVYFSLSESDFNKFKNQYQGNTLEEKVANLPLVSLILADKSTFPEHGKVDMIDGQFNRSTGSITFRATFPNEQGLLRSGNTGKVQLSLSHEGVRLIPQESTIEIQDKVFVFAVDQQNRVNKIAVQVLGKSGNNYLVDDKSFKADRIVVKGFENLEEGAQITPEKAENLLTNY